MPRTRPPYPEEFRREAVALVRREGRTVRDVAESLGVSQQSLRAWLKQTQLDAGERSDGLGLGLPREEGRGSLEDLTLLAQPAVLDLESSQLLALIRARGQAYGRNTSRRGTPRRRWWRTYKRPWQQPRQPSPCAIVVRWSSPASSGLQRS